MSSSKKPIPESYWVMPGRFLAGEYPAVRDPAQTRKRLQAFLDAGIDTFIDLTGTGENPPYLPLLQRQARQSLPVQYHHFPVPDFDVPSVAIMVTILEAIDRSLADGRNLYLHCLGGIGRTGTAVGCYLVRHGRSGPDALGELGKMYRTSAQSAFYPESPQNARQVAFVRDWKE